MKITKTFGVHFTICRNKMQNGKCAVYLRIVVNGSRAELSLKSLVYYEDWNISKGMASQRIKS